MITASDRHLIFIYFHAIAIEMFQEQEKEQAPQLRLRYTRQVDYKQKITCRSIWRSYIVSSRSILRIRRGIMKGRYMISGFPLSIPSLRGSFNGPFSALRRHSSQVQIREIHRSFITNE
jgi:hypothetical protein